MVKKVIKVLNEMGLHARPAGLIADVAGKFDCSIKIIKDSAEINAKSIMGILTLGAAKGSEIILVCEGKDAEKAAEEIEKLFKKNFDEE